MNFTKHIQIKIVFIILILSFISTITFAILFSKEKNKTLSQSIPNSSNTSNSSRYLDIYFNGIIISSFLLFLMLFILVIEKTNWKGLGTINL